MRREYIALFCLLLAFSPPSFSSESEMQAAITLAMVERLAADFSAPW